MEDRWKVMDDSQGYSDIEYVTCNISLPDIEETQICHDENEKVSKTKRFLEISGFPSDTQTCVSTQT